MLEITNCAGTLGKPNSRTENHGDEKKGAFDVPITFNIPAHLVAGLYSPEFIEAHWFGDTDNSDHKDAKFTNITLIKFDNEFEGATVELKSKTGHVTKYENCKIKGFTVRPKQFRHVELKLKFQHLVQSNDEIVTPFALMDIEDGVTVTISNAKPKAIDNSQVDAFDENFTEEEDPNEELDLSMTDIESNDDEVPTALLDDENDNAGNS